MHALPNKVSRAGDFATNECSDPCPGRRTIVVASLSRAARMHARPLHRHDDYCLRANVSWAWPVALIEVAEFVAMNCIFSDAAVNKVSVDG